MAGTLSNVRVYDPAYPFRLIDAYEPGVDTWYDNAVITRSLRERMSEIPEIGETTLNLSSGMYVKVPLIEIGIQVGSIRIENVQAAVVEEGSYDLLIGKDVLGKVFTVGQESSGAETKARVSSDIKDDPEALSIELYPMHPPVSLKSFEKVIQYERWLYNIYLISSGVVKLESKWMIDKILSDDYSIPEELQLKLTWIDTGSIWLTLKSSSQKALKYVASLFETGVSAKLAQQMAESQKAESEAKVQEATRAATVEKMIAEQNRLKAENISQTYEAWRNEIRQNLKFMDELIEQLGDEEAKGILKERKTQAILELAEQQVLPIVRNVPRPYQPQEGLFLLPPGNPPTEGGT